METLVQTNVAVSHVTVPEIPSNVPGCTVPSAVTSLGPYSQDWQVVPACTDPVSAIAVARGVSKSYRIGGETRWVLRNIDFHVNSGECVFLTGPSGSGKSTLLSIMGCLLTPDEGTVEISGVNISGLSLNALATIRREFLGFVFQKFQLIRGLSAEENVAIPLSLQGIEARVAIRRAAEMLARVGLADHCQSKTTRMSPGQCQRVALARAIISSPQLVLADEPTAALDGRSGKEVMQLLRSLIQETGAAAIVVTHDPRILEYADRICSIENGVLAT